MTGDEELLQIGQVIERLIAHYPSVAGDHIEHTVRIAHKRFDTGRIRTFIPLLVEKAARQAIDDWMTHAGELPRGA